MPLTVPEIGIVGGAAAAPLSPTTSRSAAIAAIAPTVRPSVAIPASASFAALSHRSATPRRGGFWLECQAAGSRSLGRSCSVISRSKRDGSPAVNARQSLSPSR